VEKGVSILAISSYSADYFLVRDKDSEKTISALKSLVFIVKKEQQFRRSNIFYKGHRMIMLDERRGEFEREG